jgi:iron complex outermembrane recepter protein
MTPIVVLTKKGVIMSFFKNVLVILTLMGFSLSAYTQEDVQDGSSNSTEEVSTEVQAPKSSGRVEKLEVTGSHIKRIDVEGPSPVLTLDRDYLDQTGFNNVGDVLRETTVASFGGARENALTGGAGTGASTTSLRGFGAERILVLLDGKRLPTIGGSSSVDLALIPMAAVERIEILKDGASATYGSDALGGVINVITKKDYDGATIELGYAMPDSPGGNRTDIKASYGKTFNKGSILGVLQYRANQETWSRDYDYAIPTPDWYSQFGSPGTWLDPNNGFQAGSAADPCPPEMINGDGVCTFDYSPYSQITPSIEQYSALVTGDYQLNSDTKFFATGVFTHRDVRNQLAPAPDRFRDASGVGGIDTTIDQGTATNWGLPATGDLSQVFYRLVEEGGPRRSQVTSDSFNVNTGVKGYAGDTWDWEASATYGASRTSNLGVGGYANKQILYDMAVANEFNPFLAPGAKSDISQALYQPLDTIRSTMATTNLKASGELFELPAGPLALAVGVMNAYQTFEQTTDEITGAGAQWGGGVSAVGEGQRNFQSAYTEFSVPVLTDLELQLAGRYDNYSDFGSTVNPKVGFRYKPVNQVMFRGSWGTGYRAPSLTDLYRGQIVSFPFGLDPVTGQSAQFEQVTGGNRNLREETVESINLGIVLQPIESLSLTADYWRADQDNVVSVASTRQLFMAEEKFGNSYLNQFGINIERDAGNNNRIVRIDNPSVNLASTQVSGLDLGLKFQLPIFRDFRFRLTVDHSILFEYRNEPFPGLGIENQIGFAGVPYWRNNAGIGLGNRVYDFSVLARTIGETNASALAQVPGTGGKTRDHTELDLRVQYSAPWNGTISFLVRNVLDTDRPQYLEYLSSGFLDTEVYDPFGRTFSLNYRQDF